MPRFPRVSQRVSGLTGSVFEKFRNKMRAQGENLVRLHIGDTYMAPAYALPISEEFREAFPDFNRYCSTFGVEPLREALLEKVRTDNELHIQKNHLMVTNGATNGLSATVMTLVDPGDEVLILTPAWPFFFGMVRAAGGQIVECPFYTRLYENPDLDIAAYLEKCISAKTVAIYLNTPNNPSGKVLGRDQLNQIAEVARSHRLWIISDEAYDGLTFDGRPHISIANLPEMFEQTVTLFTFSKSFMFAGLRLGFLVAGSEVVIQINKSMVHQLYSPATLSQYMMVEPVRQRQRWLPAVRDHYQELRDLFWAGLKIPIPRPEGTYFLFFSVEPYLNGRTIDAFIDQCLDAGVSVAPGIDFGNDFRNYIRICFTGEPPQRLALAVERLNRLF